MLVFQLELVRSQTNFMSCFVEDLLNLRLLRQGILQIDLAVFDPIKSVDFVINMLSIKARSKGVQLSRHLELNLAPPCDSSGPLSE